MGDMGRHKHAPDAFKYPTRRQLLRSKPEWFPDEGAGACFGCNVRFGTFKRRHHCRACGGVFCSSCCGAKVSLTALGYGEELQRVCAVCHQHVLDNIHLEEENEQELDAIGEDEDVPQLFEREDAAFPCLWNRLDMATLVMVMSYVGDASALLRLSATCRTIRKAASDNSIWHELYCARWHVSRSLTENIGLSWKSVYCEKAEREQEATRVSGPEEAPTFAEYKRTSQVLETGGAQPSRLSTSSLLQQGATVVLLGASGVGKTTAVNFLCSEAVETPVEPTVGALFASRSVCVLGRFVKLSIWDTAGQEKYHSLARMYYRNANAVILMFSHTDEDSFEMAAHWAKEVHSSAEGVVIALAGNKTDLLQGEDGAVDREEIAAFVEEEGIHIMKDICAATGEGVTELFEAVGTALFMQFGDQGDHKAEPTSSHAH